MKYNLPQFFLSYSHADSNEFNNFINILLDKTKDKWEIWNDEQIKIGEKWNSIIYQTLEGIQFYILCLSDNFLDSLYIKENELPIIIYKNLNEQFRFFPFFLSKCSKEKFNKISEYQIFMPNELQSITNGNQIASFQECENENDKLLFVDQFINKVNKIILDEDIKVNNIVNWRNDYIKKLKSAIYKNINPFDTYHSTRIEIANVISEELTTEFPFIFQAVYQLELEPGNNYLRRAIKLFEPSTKVYAISLNNISTFWKERESNYLSSEYLNIQSDINKSIFRLFVFKNINEIKEYKEILNLHYTTYGFKGNSGVFICSSSDYEQILTDFYIASLDPDLSKDSDFAILDYQNNASILIKLKSKSFSFSEISLSIKIKNKIKFTNFCDKLINLKEWDLDKKYKILKWGSLNIDRNILLNSLYPFTLGINKPTRHFLFLNNQNLKKDEIRKSLLTVKDKFDDARLNINISTVSFLEKEVFNVPDVRYGAKLQNTNKYEYCLIMDFVDVKDLKFFYMSLESSHYREEIYKIINPSIITKFSDLNNAINYEEKSQIMNEIEEVMKDYISRKDFVANDPIDEVVDFLLK